MFELLRSFLSPLRPTGPQESIVIFTTADHVITQDAVSREAGVWRIDSKEARIVRLFEIAGREIELAMLTYSAQLRTQDVRGGVYLEMWCRISGRGEFFSRDVAHKVTGTNDWASYETQFHLKRGQAVELLKLNLVIEGPGTVWVRDVQLFRTLLG
jgi:hypothetical protein